MVDRDKIEWSTLTCDGGFSLLCPTSLAEVNIKIVDATARVARRRRLPDTIDLSKKETK